jgi:hypothetical protein
MRTSGKHLLVVAHRLEAYATLRFDYSQGGHLRKRHVGISAADTTLNILA